jgi:hypothetical protein
MASSLAVVPLALTGLVCPAVASTVKPQITGLVDMGVQTYYSDNEPFPTVNTAEVAPDADAFSGIVVNIDWSQLEPTKNQFVYTALNKSLAAVTTYNQQHPSHALAVKLRVFGGYAAPRWAKTMDGNPVTVSGADTDGQWWQPDYRQAWATLQNNLAAQYDKNALVASVAMDSCASLTQEPFNMAASASVLKQIEADGWTDQKQEQCLEGAFSDYSAWQYTPIDYAFNPFKYVKPGATTFTSDTAITNTVMAECAQSQANGGPVCILSNHALDPDAADPSLSDSDVYREIDTLYTQTPGVPVDFQADGPAEGCAAIAVGVEYHGQSVELWPPGPHWQGYSAYPESTLEQWDNALKDGVPPSC